MRAHSDRQISTRAVRSSRASVPVGRLYQSEKSVASLLAPDRNSFGLIRLVLALAVLFSHSYWFTSGSSIHEPLYSLTGWTLGEHAVQVFFILSGLLVAQSFARSRSVTEFAVARTLRIFPALTVCVLATSVVLGLALTTLPPARYLAGPGLWTYQAMTISLLNTSLPLPGVLEHTPVAYLFNASLWTLKFEVLCYAILAILGWIGLFHPQMRTLSIIVTAMLVTAAGLSLQISPCDPTHAIAGSAHLCPHAYSTHQNAAYFIVYFFTGVLFFLASDVLRLNWGIVTALGLVFAATIGSRWQNLTTALFLGTTMLMIARTSFGGVTRWTRTNDLSFGIYIYAAALQQGIVTFWPGIDAPTLTLLALSAAWPCAFLSWHLIERPALTLRRELAGGRRVAAPSRRSSARGSIRLTAQ